MPDNSVQPLSSVPTIGDTGRPDKRRIAASFSHAAADYDAVAKLQRGVGESLLQTLPAGWQPQCWVDLGCGTGYFSRVLTQRFPQAQGLALDIAEGMIRYARAHSVAEYFIGADAECLPLHEASCDLLFSNLAIQWCANLPAVFAEAQRVLRPGGILVFSSLCAGTLAELGDSWRMVDGFIHVNRFRSFANYLQHAAGSGLISLSLHHEDRVLYFPELRSLTHELKALGAHNLNPGRPNGLTGRARLRALTTAYERLRRPQGLPATYRVVFGALRKGQ